MKRSLILGWLICFIGPLKAQIVWPGDVNNNGLVNHIDLLYLSQVFGETGPPRANQGIEWEAKDIDALWANDFPNGVNHAYADTNGDGFVDFQDQEAIFENNFFFDNDLTHGVVIPDDFDIGILGESPSLFFGEPTDPIFEGAPTHISLQLGTEDLPVNDFYGIAFTISFDNAIINTDMFPFPAGFLFGGDWVTEGIDWIFPDFLENKIHIVITKTNQMPSGITFGELGSFFIVIIDDVVGFGEDKIETQMMIEDIKLINEDGGTTAVLGDTIVLEIFNDDIVNNDEKPLEQIIKVFPNPISETLFIESTTTAIKAIHLFDMTGKSIKQLANLNDQKVSFPVQTFPSGLYSLHIQTSIGNIVKKITIAR